MKSKMVGAAIVLVASAAVAGPGRARVAAPSAPTLDVRQLMTHEAFQAAGLAKLSPVELDALNRWITDLALKIYADKQRHSGCDVAVETNIDGEFQGWTGDTTFTLMNGQIWKQTDGAYTYSYAYGPEVAIYKSAVGCKMRVDGVQGAIVVERLK